MSLAVLAATLTTVVVFFPVTFLYGVSKFLFSALALAVAISLFASYFVAMTVIPLFCARFLKGFHQHAGRTSRAVGSTPGSTAGSPGLLDFYERWVRRALRRPVLTIALLTGSSSPASRIYPLLGVAFFPQTDAGQFTINLKVPTGTRIEATDDYVAKIEQLIRKAVDPADFKMIVSNIGIVPDFSALYTTNAGPYTATIQVALNDSHRVSSFEYMDRVRRQIASLVPGSTHVLLQRIDGGRHPQHGRARADRRPGQQPRSGYHLQRRGSTWPRRSANCRASARSIFRRT